MAADNCFLLFLVLFIGFTSFTEKLRVFINLFALLTSECLAYTGPSSSLENTNRCNQIRGASRLDEEFEPIKNSQRIAIPFMSGTLIFFVFCLALFLCLSFFRPEELSPMDFPTQFSSQNRQSRN